MQNSRPTEHTIAAPLMPGKDQQVKQKKQSVARVANLDGGSVNGGT